MNYKKIGVVTYMMKIALILCFIGATLSIISFGISASEKENEINMLKAQIETYEPELPEGFMKALDERTITRLDIFCADWDELRRLE